MFNEQRDCCFSYGFVMVAYEPKLCCFCGLLMAPYNGDCVVASGFGAVLDGISSRRGSG